MSVPQPGALKRQLPHCFIERRAVDEIVRPHVARLDAWHKEAAYLNALVMSARAADVQRVRKRSAELLSDVTLAFDRFAAETSGVVAAGRVSDLRHSYQRLMLLLSLGAGE